MRTMASKRLTALFALALTLSSPVAVALAQDAEGHQQWQAGWDQRKYDPRHVILGTVERFTPYRLDVARQSGQVQTIDLKKGTVILPANGRPAPNERVAVVGSYSNGTFIADRVIVWP